MKGREHLHTDIYNSDIHAVSVVQISAIKRLAVRDLFTTDVKENL